MNANAVRRILFVFAVLALVSLACGTLPQPKEQNALELMFQATGTAVIAPTMAPTQTPTLTPTEEQKTKVPPAETALPTVAPAATVPSAPQGAWTGIEGDLEFVHGDVDGAVYARTPLTAGDHARICDISFSGNDFGGFVRHSAIIPAGGTVWSLNVTGAETIACRGFGGTPEELATWAITPEHLGGFIQPSRNTEGVEPDQNEIMVLRFMYEGGQVFIEKLAPGSSVSANWYIEHFDLSFHEGSNQSNVPLTVVSGD